MTIEVNKSISTLNRKIVLSDAAQHGIQNVTKEKPVYTEEYLELVKEADKKIEEARREEARAWVKAKNYLAE